MTTLLRKQWIITISPFVSDCTNGYNLSVSYNTRLKCRQKMPSHSIHVHAKFHLENFNSKHDIVVAIYHVRNNHFLTNQMSFDSHVASFASTHSKTRPVGCDMMPPIRKTWPRFDIHINDEVIPNPNISLSVISMYGTITVWPIRCLLTIMSLLLH